MIGAIGNCLKNAPCCDSGYSWSDNICKENPNNNNYYPTSYWIKTYNVTENQLANGYTKSMVVLERLMLLLSEGDYYVGITKVNSTTAVFEIMNMRTTKKAYSLLKSNFRKNK